MEVYIEKTKERRNLKFEGTLGELLLKLDLQVDEVFVEKDDQVILEDENLHDDDKIVIHSVVSGG